ncbi:hypothetical protein ES703_110392 [subsurface metagenome]
MTTDLTKQDSMDLGIDISDLMMIMMMLMMVSLLTTVIPTATQALQVQAYTGLTDERVLEANRFLQWINLVTGPPYIPWVSASFHNDGPQSVFIAVNNPDEMLEVANGESHQVDMTGATRRIEFLFYKCNVGETASVRVIGKY